MARATSRRPRSPTWSARIYDGSSNDLLTAGLGTSGMQSATVPGFADPATRRRKNCAARDLHQLPRAGRSDAGRRLRHALRARTCGGRHGDRGEGKIAGTSTSPSRHDGPRPVTLMVQIPTAFDPTHACIVTAPLLRLARHLRAIATCRRVGPQAWLRGRLHRQGQRHRRATTSTTAWSTLLRGERRPSPPAGESTFTAAISQKDARRVERRVPQPLSPSSTPTRSRTRRGIGARTCCNPSASPSTC